MSVGVVRVQKMTSGSVKGIEIHDKRKKDVSHTNGDIDWSKSHSNYDLHTDQNSSFTQAVKRKIDTLERTRAVRKDAVVMAQVLVTSDKAFFDGLSKEQQQQFFKDSYDFMANRYGKENVVSAVVHLDERTPHMHFNFVPITADGRLSAKSILTRQALIEQQTAFYEQVGKTYGLGRGKTDKERAEQGDTRKNMSMPEYKAYTKQLAELKQEVQALTQRLESLQGIELPIRDINALAPQKTLTGAIKGISLEDIENLKRTALEGATWHDKAIQLGEDLGSTKAELERVLADNKKRPTQIDLYKAKGEVLSAKAETDKLVDRVNTVLEKLPPDVAKQFMEKWQAEKQLEKGVQSRGRGE